MTANVDQVVDQVLRELLLHILPADDVPRYPARSSRTFRTTLVRALHALGEPEHVIRALLGYSNSTLAHYTSRRVWSLERAAKEVILTIADESDADAILAEWDVMLRRKKKSPYG